MAQKEALYEIVETKYIGDEKIRTKLKFLGPLEKAKQTADEKAKKNIGSRYSVFPEGGFVAEFRYYYRTTIKCPKCGEKIPIE